MKAWESRSWFEFTRNKLFNSIKLKGGKIILINPFCVRVCNGLIYQILRKIKWWGWCLDAKTTGWIYDNVDILVCDELCWLVALCVMYMSYQIIFENGNLANLGRKCLIYLEWKKEQESKTLSVIIIWLFWVNITIIWCYS